MLDMLKADRGMVRERTLEQAGPGYWTVVSRLGNLKLGGSAVTLWMQLQGSCQVDTRDGSFRLERGDWLVLDRDAAPQVQSQRNALTLGLALPEDRWEALTAHWEHAAMPGHGRMALADRRVAMRLWRQSMREHADPERTRRCLRILLMHFKSLQPELGAYMQRCPGRSRHYKRHVLGRLQRARLFLEANAHRVVRLSELAALTNLSPWYFSKTFHAIYGETPQAAGGRFRLERSLRLLTSTSLTVSEIGEACGFENCCSFSRAFRAHFGTTATGCRAAHSRKAA